MSPAFLWELIRMHPGGGRDSLKVVAVATDGAFRTISNGNSINDLNY